MKILVKELGITNPKEVFQKLKEMGYKDLYIWQDSPNTFYDWHTHPNDEIRYVLEGSTTIKVKENNLIHEYNLQPGQFIEVKSNTLHNAYTKTGVKYVCGSK